MSKIVGAFYPFRSEYANGRAEVRRAAPAQERGTLARVGYLTNQPRTFGLTARFNF
ncbi:MAG TPA: hypothetical protein VMT87_12530 [Vicinamibacteria bacterium]|nr:hypothetical protein [Vicinamibacteria bacterium]